WLRTFRSDRTCEGSRRTGGTIQSGRAPASTRTTDRSHRLRIGTLYRSGKAPLSKLTLRLAPQDPDPARVLFLQKRMPLSAGSFLNTSLQAGSIRAPTLDPHPRHTPALGRPGRACAMLSTSQ